MNPEMQDNPQQVPPPAPEPVAPQPVTTVPMEQIDHRPQTVESIQNTMRKTVLKIIGIMSGLSLVVVFLVFLVSGAADSSLTTLKPSSNPQANYSVPSSWSEDNVGDFVAYYNQGTLDASQATYLVVRPVRVSFDSERISESQTLSLTEEYRRRVNNSDAGAMLSDPVSITVNGFHQAYDLELDGLADDNRTEIRGLSRVLFDDNNYAHTVEFVAVRSYWEANESEILNLIDSYTIRSTN